MGVGCRKNPAVVFRMSLNSGEASKPHKTASPQLTPSQWPGRVDGPMGFFDGISWCNFLPTWDFDGVISSQPWANHLVLPETPPQKTPWRVTAGNTDPTKIGLEKNPEAGSDFLGSKNR